MNKQQQKIKENAILYAQKLKEQNQNDKISSQTDTNTIEITSNVITITTETTTETTTESIIIEPTIFDKYRHYIEQVKSNYIRGMTHAEAMEIHRYCEKKLNRQLSIDTSCSKCMLDRIKMFASFEKK